MPLVGIVQSNIRDGSYCYDSNDGGGPNYYPNSFDTKSEDVSQQASRWKLPAIVEVKRYDTTHDDNYSQVFVDILIDVLNYFFINHLIRWLNFGTI